MHAEMNSTTLRYLVKKKREEMIQLTKRYFLTSPGVIQVSQELENLLNMLRKGEAGVKGGKATSTGFNPVKVGPVTTIKGRHLSHKRGLPFIICL